MLTLEDATLIACKYIKEKLERPSLPLTLLRDSTQEHPFGWVFFYTSQLYAVTRDPNHAIGGNAPLLVERHSGRVFLTGTAKTIDTYVQRYLETGDPNGKISRRVLLSIAEVFPDKRLTIQAIRDICGLSMFGAKHLVDRCMFGDSVTIDTPDPDAASILISRLQSLGWSAKRFYADQQYYNLGHSLSQP